MTRLEKVIEQVKDARKGDANHRPWIFDDDGHVREDVLCGEVLDFLKECKDYELTEEEFSDDEIQRIVDGDYDDANNTYNFGGNVSNDINWTSKKVNDGYIILIMIHLFGDIRGGYSDMFVIKVNYENQIFEFESATQHKDINDRYIADINIFSECYDVYDTKSDDSVDGTFYELEVKDVLEKLNKIMKERRC